MHWFRPATILAAVPFLTAPAGSNERKIADLYASYMNTKAIDARGLKTDAISAAS